MNISFTVEINQISIRKKCNLKPHSAPPRKAFCKGKNMATFQIQEHWNSSSQHLVCAYDDGGTLIGLLGTVYAPRGRRWATIMETGHQPFKDVIGMAHGVQAGAEILFDRFVQNMNPRYHD
jgi:hypothetical protein